MSTEQFGDMRTEYSKSLIAIGEQDPNVVVLGADTTDSLKTAGFGKKFPERFFNVGIAEANLVSVAADLHILERLLLQAHMRYFFQVDVLIK